MLHYDEIYLCYIMMRYIYVTAMMRCIYVTL